MHDEGCLRLCLHPPRAEDVYAAEVGDMPLQRTHLEKLRSVALDFIPSLFRGDYRPFVRPEDMKLLLDSLRRAGLGN